MTERLAGPDPLLASVIYRCVEIGSEQAADEFEVAEPVIAIAENRFTGDLDHAVTALEQAAKADLWWATPWMVRAVGHLASGLATGTAIVDGDGPERLLSFAASLLVALFDVAPDQFSLALQLAQMEWPEVHQRLTQLEPSDPVEDTVEPSPEDKVSETPSGSWTVSELDVLARASLAVKQHAEWFAPDSELPVWAGELADLLTAARQRRREVAVQEHQLILLVRGVLADENPTEERRADLLGQVAAAIGSHYQRHGNASWILPAGVQAARHTADHTDPSHPDYPARASNLGGLIAEAVGAGLVDKTQLVEALGWLRKAVEATD
ncbi:MAG: hypothetical protein LBO20_02480, partial [Bifidobacteriaceae bacterium]|nr:hypothetical protein [Bifidobacteriaceae bacterium]